MVTFLLGWFVFLRGVNALLRALVEGRAGLTIPETFRDFHLIPLSSVSVFSLASPPPHSPPLSAGQRVPKSTVTLVHLVFYGDGEEDLGV